MKDSWTSSLASSDEEDSLSPRKPNAHALVAASNLKQIDEEKLNETFD